MSFKTNIMYLLTGLSILFSFLFCIWILAFHDIPEGNRELFIHVLGMIDGAFVGALVATFYGSSKKDHEQGTSVTTTIERTVKETPTEQKKQEEP